MRQSDLIGGEAAKSALPRGMSVFFYVIMEIMEKHPCSLHTTAPYSLRAVKKI